MNRNKSSLSSKNAQIRLVPNQILTSLEKDKILNQWINIPPIMEISDVAAFNSLSQEVRSEIMDLLREGIEEYNKQEKRKIIRHVFSAKEIRTLIKGKFEEDLKISNVYFHLNKLEKLGFIQTIASITRGKIATTYFGRTAKLFIYKKQDDFINSNKIDSFLRLLEELDPFTHSEDYKGLILKIKDIFEKNHEKIRNWLSKEENEEKISRLNIDIRDLYTFLQFLLPYIEPPNETATKIAEILNLEHISNHKSK